MAEWNYLKNDSLGFLPNILGTGSHTKVWWICKEGHEWEASIVDRVKGHGCLYCSRQKPIVGENDFATLYPELVKEWHPIKNGKLKPEKFLPGSHKKVWWQCKNGHEWETEIKCRTSMKTNCPYCGSSISKKVLPGFNDLQTKYPGIAAEWDNSKNDTLKPTDVSYGSGKKVWWLCPNKHSYKAAVYERTKGRGCPVCISSQRTSFPEQAFYFYIKKVFPDALNGNREVLGNGMELDIYIPSIKVGIEYDGKIYHSSDKNRLRDSRKYRICKSKGIMLIRVTDAMRGDLIIKSDHQIQIIDENPDSLNDAIRFLCMKLGKEVHPDVKRDRKEILSSFESRANSLTSDFPNIAREWNYEKNDPLKPEQFAPHSNEKVWWRCSDCGTEWQAAIGDRTRPDSTGCPSCSRKNAAKIRVATIVENRKNIASEHPELLDEWDYERNRGTDPKSFTSGSGRKFWWKCRKCGYNWQATASHRISGRGCPCCSNKAVVPGKNDLATTNPELIPEWDASNTLKITEVTQGCGKKANWVCKFGHKWVAVIATRSKGTGCPVCAKSKRVHARMRKVEKIDKETGEVVACYGSLTEAAASVSQSISSISIACKKGTTAGGYKWRYAEMVSNSVND